MKWLSVSTKEFLYFALSNTGYKMQHLCNTSHLPS